MRFYEKCLGGIEPTVEFLGLLDDTMNRYKGEHWKETAICRKYTFFDDNTNIVSLMLPNAGK